MFDRRHPHFRSASTSLCVRQLYIKYTGLNLALSSDDGRPSFQIEFVLVRLKLRKKCIIMAKLAQLLDCSG